MKVSVRFVLYPLIMIAMVLLGAYLGYRFSHFRQETTIQQEALMEKVQNVLKLGTVEGVFSEIFNYSDYYTYDISPFRKKALIRIRAHVLVGYELDSLEININQFSKKVVINRLPRPTILSIDHELKYYDITEGTFNSFSAEDYNRLQKQSKDFIRKKAMESSLFHDADRQIREHLSTLGWLLREQGWDIEIKQDPKRDFSS